MVYKVDNIYCQVQRAGLKMVIWTGKTGTDRKLLSNWMVVIATNKKAILKHSPRKPVIVFFSSRKKTRIVSSTGLLIIDSYQFVY